MNIQKNISLKKFNTFGIDAKAKFFLQVNSIEELKNALELKEYDKKFIISGGSNMLITKDINALVLHINLKGKQVISETNEHVLVKVMAGEVWHDMVLWCLDQDFGGLENMSLIPGNTGTSPIQNIGAYGVELKDNFSSCEALKKEDLSMQKFSKEECKFGYRDSFFKNEGKNQYIITSVTFKLTKTNHQLNTSYGAIEEALKSKGIHHPTIKDVSNAVVSIRQSKLPDPKELGNSGSFFKNPVLNKLAFNKFIKEHPKAKYYEVSNNAFKIPAGWMIEACGFKGKRFGDAGVHKNQALVLVNHGNATGTQILELAHAIIDTVYKKFGVKINPEVNIIK